MTKDWRGWNLTVTKLTDYEISVLSLVAQGISTGKVAEELGKSHTSVTTTLARIRRKLGAQNTTHAAVIAVRNHLL